MSVVVVAAAAAVVVVAILPQANHPEDYYYWCGCCCCRHSHGCGHDRSRRRCLWKTVRDEDPIHPPTLRIPPIHSTPDSLLEEHSIETLQRVCEETVTWLCAVMDCVWGFVCWCFLVAVECLLVVVRCHVGEYSTQTCAIIEALGFGVIRSFLPSTIAKGPVMMTSL